MRKRILAIICVVAVFVSGTLLYSAFAEPGSSDDPIVTKSYIDSVLADFKASFRVPTAPPAAPSEEAPTFVLHSMMDSQRLVCEAGTEFIIRQGSGIVVSTEKGGLADVTQGYDIANGEIVPANHLIIVPVTEGRGFRAQGNVLVLVRGNSSIVEN